MSASLSAGLLELGSAALALADTVTSIAANVVYILSVFGLL
ncbi:hypothetical protein [Nocardia wallacei]|nr:hypothetical protein [Nocardia wallacei]